MEFGRLGISRVLQGYSSDYLGCSCPFRTFCFVSRSKLETFTKFGRGYVDSRRVEHQGISLVSREL